MISEEDIRPISYIKANTAGVLSQVNETHRPVFITQNGEAKAVLMDTESYENMKDALGLLKIVSLGERDIQKGRVIPQDEVFSKQMRKFKK